MKHMGKIYFLLLWSLVTHLRSSAIASEGLVHVLQERAKGLKNDG